MSSLALSVLLSLASVIAYAAGAILQEYVASTSASRAYAPVDRPGWWAAVALNGTGAALHVAALAYGPLSVVQPLGALTLVFALPMAALFVRRGSGARAWRGALLTTAGLAGLLALTDGSTGVTPGSGERAVLAATAFGTVALLFLAAHGVHRRVLRGVLLATAAGVAFGIASVFTKTVAEDWAWNAPLRHWPALVVVGVLAVLGLLLSQAAYRGSGLAAPLATVTVVNPVAAAAVGIALFGEGFRYGALGAALAVVCGAVAAGGIVLLTRERLGGDRPGRTGGGRTAGGGRSRTPAAPVRGPGRKAGSHADAPGPEVGERVDVGAEARAGADLEVQVRSGAVAGGS
ncbi:DMT family transporter [Streptomyces sp. C10-9-1]|uniref:DMT family transporter n=1 Tax=Streptomyces sp. C10-9-1 TaxID=1859285 RepID=UPI0021110276|nr:DMT family transporter [Streptomyces sp. C10-9-1]MCQ6555740.1 DMT family transporter [Streptomyces sp. C10-9-1]